MMVYSTKQGYALVWAILVYDELEYLQNTVARLQQCGKPIYVMCDVKSPPALKEWLNDEEIEYSEYAFDGHYGNMRNELDIRLRDLDKYDWVCQLDADELPTLNLVTEIEEIIKHSRVDKINVCRFNCYTHQIDDIDVEDLFDAVNSGQIYQMERLYNVEPIELVKRMYRLDAGVKWHGRIHEWPQTEDDSIWADLPMAADFCLWHEKTPERQEMQNQKYEQYEEHRDLAASLERQQQWLQEARARFASDTLDDDENISTI
jgi:hypothetical protein